MFRQKKPTKIKPGEEVALVRNGEIMATMRVEEIYEMTEADKKWECEMVFKGKARIRKNSGKSLLLIILA